MCRAVKVMCAAGSPARLDELRRAAVGASWEVVGGVASASAVAASVAEWSPDVLVMDQGLGEAAIAAAREARPGIRVVAIGRLAAADVETELDAVREAILGLARPGGPVRGPSRSAPDEAVRPGGGSLGGEDPLGDGDLFPG